MRWRFDVRQRVARADRSERAARLYEWLFAPPGSLPAQWDPRGRGRAARGDRRTTRWCWSPTTGRAGRALHRLPGHPLGPVRLPRWLEDLAVDPERRSEGIGKALLDAAKDWARERGATHLELDSGDARPTPTASTSARARLDLAPVRLGALATEPGRAQRGGAVEVELDARRPGRRRTERQTAASAGSIARAPGLGVRDLIEQSTTSRSRLDTSSSSSQSRRPRRRADSRPGPPEAASTPEYVVRQSGAAGPSRTRSRGGDLPARRRGESPRSASASASCTEVAVVAATASTSPVSDRRWGSNSSIGAKVSSHRPPSRDQKEPWP